MLSVKWIVNLDIVEKDLEKVRHNQVKMGILKRIGAEGPMQLRLDMMW